MPLAVENMNIGCHTETEAKMLTKRVVMEVGSILKSSSTTAR